MSNFLWTVIFGICPTLFSPASLKKKKKKKNNHNGVRVLSSWDMTDRWADKQKKKKKKKTKIVAASKSRMDTQVLQITQIHSMEQYTHWWCATILKNIITYVHDQVCIFVFHFKLFDKNLKIMLELCQIESNYYARNNARCQKGV